MNKLFAFAAAVSATLSGTVNVAAQTCTAAPSCADLGYTQSSTACSGKYIKCPFDTSKVMCVNGGPHVGDLKYSLYSTNHDGWLRCDGSQYSTTTYKKLYNVIGTNFCRTYTSRTHTGTTGKCSSGKFAVPDYRGFFLRGYKVSNSSAVDKLTSPNWPTISNALYYKGNYHRYGGSSGGVDDSLYIPEYERLPNITGEFGMLAGGAEVGWNNAVSTTNNAFYRKDGIGDNGNQSNTQAGGVGFQASRSNTIYDGGHVVPANYAAYIFIYAGE